MNRLAPTLLLAALAGCEVETSSIVYNETDGRVYMLSERTSEGDWTVHFNADGSVDLGNPETGLFVGRKKIRELTPPEAQRYAKLAAQREE